MFVLNAYCTQNPSPVKCLTYCLTGQLASSSSSVGTLLTYYESLRITLSPIFIFICRRRITNLTSRTETKPKGFTPCITC